MWGWDVPPWLPFLDGVAAPCMVFSEGPDAVGIFLGYCGFDMLVLAFPWVVNLYPLWIFPSPSQYLVLFSCISKCMPVIDVGVLVLFELLRRRCVVSSLPLFVLLRHSAHVSLSPGVRSYQSVPIFGLTLVLEPWKAPFLGSYQRECGFGFSLPGSGDRLSMPSWRISKWASIVVGRRPHCRSDLSLADWCLMFVNVCAPETSATLGRLLELWCGQVDGWVLGVWSSRSFVHISWGSRSFPPAYNVLLCLSCSCRSWAVLLLGQCLACLGLVGHIVSLGCRLLDLCPLYVWRSIYLTVYSVCYELLPCPILVLSRHTPIPYSDLCLWLEG